MYAQVNWWTPIRPLAAERTIAFYPAYWDRPLANTSADWRLEDVWAAGAKRGPLVPEPTEPVDAASELRIVVEAGDYFKSSDVQLDGVDAPATHQFTWKELPSGAYRVEAILTRADGERTTVTECFAVLGADDSADALRGPPKRSALPDASAGRSGC